MVICLERCADLHMAQLMPLPLTVSCFSKIHIGFTFLVPAHLGSPGERVVKRVCVCVVCFFQCLTSLYPSFYLYTVYACIVYCISCSFVLYWHTVLQYSMPQETNKVNLLPVLSYYRRDGVELETIRLPSNGGARPGSARSNDLAEMLTSCV